MTVSEMEKLIKECISKMIYINVNTSINFVIYINVNTLIYIIKSVVI